MAAQTAFTDEQKLAFVTLAQKEGRAAAAKKAKVSAHTISAWARANGVTFPPGKKAKAAPKKKRRARKAAANGHANGKANGHRVGMPATSASLDQIQDHVNRALFGLQQMRAAFRQVFG